MVYNKYKKVFYINLTLFIIHNYISAQCSLSGIIILDDPVEKTPISQIQVSILELDTIILTNDDGKFILSNLRSNKYTLKLDKDKGSYFKVILKNLYVTSEIELDTLFLVPFYTPIKDFALGHFGNDGKKLKEYYKSKKCGYSGFYKNDKLEGAWKFYDEKTNEAFHVYFKDSYLIIDLDSVSLKYANKLIKRISEIYY